MSSAGGRIAESGSDLLGFVLLRGIFGGRGPRSASEVLGLGCKSMASVVPSVLGGLLS